MCFLDNTKPYSIHLSILLNAAYRLLMDIHLDLNVSHNITFTYKPYPTPNLTTHYILQAKPYKMKLSRIKGQYATGVEQKALKYIHVYSYIINLVDQSQVPTLSLTNDEKQ